MQSNMILKQTMGKNEFLWFQIGRMEIHFDQFPIYEGKHVVGHIDSDKQSQVFHLLGFGSTQEKAEKMAGVKL